jgi:hypothetical protein
MRLKIQMLSRSFLIIDLIYNFLDIFVELEHMRRALGKIITCFHQPIHLLPIYYID